MDWYDPKMKTQALRIAAEAWKLGSISMEPSNPARLEVMDTAARLFGSLKLVIPPDEAGRILCELYGRDEALIMMNAIEEHCKERLVTEYGVVEETRTKH